MTGITGAVARAAQAKSMISGPHPPKWTAVCADCGQSDTARLALPVNGEYRCKAGCAADAGESASESATVDAGVQPTQRNLMDGAGDCACPPRCNDCGAGMHFLCLACGGVPTRETGRRTRTRSE